MSSPVLAAISFGAAGTIAASHLRDRFESTRNRRAAQRRIGLRPDRPPARSPREVIATSPSVVLAPALAVGGLMSLGPLGLATSAVPFVAERSWKRHRQRVRSETLANELAPALQLVVGHLRVGRNFVGAITEVADTVPEPLASILQEVVDETRVGVPIDDVLQRVAEREGDRHLGIVASAVGLQIRLGGSLVDILETVIDTIEEEDRLRRDIRSLTADGRMSAQVLLAMPPIMLVFTSVMSPGYTDPLFNDPLGRTMSISAVTLALVGWRWLWNLSSHEVVA